MATQARISVATEGRGFVDVTAQIDKVVRESGVRVGLCSVFIQHTSASLCIQENADPSVRRDLLTWLDKIAPEHAGYEHDDEGPDDMPAHLKSALLHTHETIPIVDGKLGLGTWQALYLVEHRRRPHTRHLLITIL